MKSLKLQTSELRYPILLRLIGFKYRWLLRPVLFRMDAESVHDRFIRTGEFLGRHAPLRWAVQKLFFYRDKRLEQKILGIAFSNPVGLAAGFDKNAQLVGVIPDVGFGFMEVGSITAEPCIGNAKPRLWRLIKSRALVVNYGLKSKGAQALSDELKDRPFRIPVGISIAKTNCTATVEPRAAVADYGKTLDAFAETTGAFYVINISCPNAHGGTPFSEPELLDDLLTATDFRMLKKPLFLKFGADLEPKQLDTLLAVALRHRVDGFVCSNLTKKRDGLKIIDATVPPVGGISGMAVQELSDRQIAHVYTRTKGRYPVIGVGGVFSAQDAYRKIRLGASLVELITGMIFRGPQLIGEINRGLVQLLERDGFSNISQAIGADIRLKDK